MSKWTIARHAGYALFFFALALMFGRYATREGHTWIGIGYATIMLVYGVLGYESLRAIVVGRKDGGK